MLNFFRILLLFIFFILQGCATSNYTDSRESFYKGNFTEAANSFRVHYDSSADKDRLLYLLEAGIVFHTQGNYKKSIQLFQQAEQQARFALESISESVSSFAINDNTTTYNGEHFELVLINFYLALNHILLEDYDNAKRYFRKLEMEHKILKLTEEKYQQNLMARYLDALISEYTENYNDARVQYTNIMSIDPDINITGDRYILALKENDVVDQEKYSSGKSLIHAYNADLKRISYSSELGEIVIINQGGRAATRVSRGKIKESQEFQTALGASLQIAIQTGAANLEIPAILAAVGEAENPVPEYKIVDPVGSEPQQIYINGKLVSDMIILNDYSLTAMKEFNSRYSKIVTGNVASLAAKIVTAAVVARVAAEAAKKAAAEAKSRLSAKGPLGHLASFATDKLIESGSGYLAGKLAGALVKPDLRSWSLLPSNYQIQRFFLEPGEYIFQFNIPGSRELTDPVKIQVVKQKPYFINLRTLNN